MKPVIMTLVQAVLVAVNVPGMLEGQPMSIVAGIFCSACFGFTATLLLLTSNEVKT